MNDIPSSVFFNFFIYLFIPFLIGLLFRRFRISSLIGYILGGILLATFFGRLISPDTINHFAYFGIILLLFTVGLEIQFDRMMTVKRFIVLGGILQIATSVIGIFILSLFFHFSIIQSFLISIALASSSTSLVAKIIQDRGEEHSFLGELVMGILMFQDLAFIPFMIIFTSITANTVSIVEISSKILLAIASSSIILLAVYYAGRKIIPVLFDAIAKTSRELLNFFIIVFIFLIGFTSSLFGIPVLVGIFISGILVSQTLEHYHIFSQIRPLRDILAIIFFIYIGTNINLIQILHNLHLILLFTFLLIVIKAISIFIIFLLFRFSTRLSFNISQYLFQVDEDAFILLSLSFVNKMFTHEQYLFLISSVLLSLMLTPFIIANKDSVYKNIRGFMKKYLSFLDIYFTRTFDRDSTPIDVLTIKDHVIICGYGRIGSNIGRALMLADIPFLAIDYNFHTVEEAIKRGINIIYGDPTDRDILDYAEIESAKTLILTLPDRYSQEAIVLTAKKLNPDIVILSRVHKREHQRRMRDLGVEVVVQPEFEASLSIIRRIYLWRGIDKLEIASKIKRLKLEHGMV